MKASAMRAVPESFWIFRIIARAVEGDVLGCVGRIFLVGLTQEDHELRENQIDDRNVGSTFRYSHEERLQVLSDKYRIGSDESDLGIKFMRLDGNQREEGRT